MSKKVNLSWDLKNTKESAMGRPEGRVSSAETHTSQGCSRTQKRVCVAGCGEWAGLEVWEKPPPRSQPVEHHPLTAYTHPASMLGPTPCWVLKIERVYDIVPAPEELPGQRQGQACNKQSKKNFAFWESRWGNINHLERDGDISGCFCQALFGLVLEE